MQTHTITYMRGDLRRKERTCSNDQWIQLKGDLMPHSMIGVEPHELVKKSGGLEKARVHWHAVAYANKLRANGHVAPILPERGVCCKRPNRSGQHHDP